MTLYSKKIIKERFLKYKNLSHIKKYPFFSIKNQFAGHLEMLVKIYLSQKKLIVNYYHELKEQTDVFRKTRLMRININIMKKMHKPSSVQI
jgi:hypothetical protein